MPSASSRPDRSRVPNRSGRRWRVRRPIATTRWPRGTWRSHPPRSRPPSDPTRWVVGAELQWKLFDGFGREHRVAASRLAEQEIATRRDGARRDVATLVQSRYDEYGAGGEQDGHPQ